MPAEAKSVAFKGYKTGSSYANYGKPVREKPDKEGDMYPINWPPYDNVDVDRKIGKILEPLSLFAPFPHEDTPAERPDLSLKRPTTPINEEIRFQPLSFEKLAKYIRRRITAKPDIPDIDIEGQKLLAGILIGEVTGIWPDIRRQIDDPFLTAEQNRELNRRIAVHIVTVCEELFNHYVAKAQVLNSRGIFSGPANMSRLKAQLALDANKFLNVLTIRRYIVADMRACKDDVSMDSEDFIYTTKKPEAPKLSFQGLIETSRPKSRGRVRYHSPEAEARQISRNMPVLDTSKVLDLVADLPDRQLDTPSQASEKAPSRASGARSAKSGVSNEELSMVKVRLKRSRSLPEIQQGETIMEELDIEPTVRNDNILEQEIKFLQRQCQRSSQEAKTVKEKSPQPGSREYAEQDLKKLMKKSPSVHVGEDMPPLLQAITTSVKHDGRKEKLEEQLKVLQEKERREQEEANIPLRGPTHPQPATIATKLPNKMEVRASDIRVSERVCMSSITIDKYATVYNDLIEEIHPNTVKLLDRNLFLGEEIREVYQEIMKTVPSTHLDLDDDDMVIPAADTVNVTDTMASATLSKKRSERVINPAFLKENRKPPWGQLDLKEWVKTPNNPPKNFNGEEIFAPMTPNMEKVHEVIRNPSKMTQIMTTEGMPTFVQDKMSRTYASWLHWWKSTITSDDYMKYLSTQETDYMGCVFHFYDSEEEDEEDVVAPAPTVALGTSRLIASQSRYKPSSARIAPSAKLSEKILKEQERKMDELKAQKEEYQEGFWNVNSVLMGGLGKDPPAEALGSASEYQMPEQNSSVWSRSINKLFVGFKGSYAFSSKSFNREEEEESSTKAPKSADTSRSARTLAERAAARHSAKRDKSRQEMLVSRASKVTTMTNISKMDVTQSSLSVNDASASSQERLERVWNSLEMPDGLKLDMAIKYSGNEFYVKLNQAIERWEKATDLILKREQLLGKLEKFERNASDPNRFFEKGEKRSSVQRLREAQKRSYYYKRIDLLDSEIKHELHYMRENFRDVITFKGRPYHDKMKWDRVEMLHWLQEERKENALKYEATLKQMPLKTAQFDSLLLTGPVAFEQKSQ